ncbi:unnamed protein product [Thelazia callipaeda]|uniref:Adenosine kinase n=1 Tax=Thelazia callipaeda TaxID=103827 RepID=A0A158RAP5_THECL|nr:unnamed protein product [Thelazia callipaeda]
MATSQKLSKCSEGIILGCGNPLLDLQTDVNLEYLQKWNLNENDAILASDQHIPMFEELVKNPNTLYLPGGATQNTLRVFQWITNEPNRATFFGCIGDDKYGVILREKAREAGLNVCYQVKKGKKTGMCAALITGQQRSLCAHLAAANLFTFDHLEEVENRTIIDKAQYFYISGFFITVCPEAVKFIAKHASEHNKVLTFNLAAQFIPKLFGDDFLAILSYVDILFGNESEALAFAEANHYNTHDLHEIGARIAAFPKVNTRRNRIVIITQGSDPTLVFQMGDDALMEFSVQKLKAEEIIDTNGAGDAFVGGFLAQFVQNKSIAECIECGHYAARAIIQQEGCTIPPTCLYH